MFAHTIALALSLLTIATAGHGVAELCSRLDAMRHAAAVAASPTPAQATAHALEVLRVGRMGAVASTSIAALAD